MIQEFDTALMKEAISMEKPLLRWETIHGSRTPIAEVDLRKYRLGYNSLRFTPGSSDVTDFLAEPLKKTWPNQFNKDYPSKWLEGDKLLDFYKRYPSNYRGMPAAKHPDVPFVGFLLAGVLLGDNKKKPAIAQILTLDETIPEKIHKPAIATNSELRRLGLASKFVEYSFLVLNHFKVADRMEWDTNTLGSQVSGGWSPTPLWSRFGIEYGRMPHYGSSSEETGDGAFYFANLEKSSENIAKTNQWAIWVEGLKS